MQNVTNFDVTGFTQSLCQFFASEKLTQELINDIKTRKTDLFIAFA